MLWPADHPALSDPRLAPHRAAADLLVPRGRCGRVLRYRPGRRVTSRVRVGGGPAVLKLHARPHALGDARRLALLSATPAATVVPRSLAVDDVGHAALLEWVEGDVLASLTGPRFVEGMAAAGEALGCLHRSGARLDRRWTVEDELVALLQQATPRSQPLASRLAARAHRLADGPALPGHRDLHPQHVVIAPGGAARLIDLDAAAMAPAPLDVGAMLAHLRRDVAVGARSADEAEAAAAAFVEGYGGPLPDVDCWEALAVARLAALAESRHARPDRAEAILAAAPSSC